MINYSRPEYETKKGFYIEIDGYMTLGILLNVRK